MEIASLLRETGLSKARDDSAVVSMLAKKWTLRSVEKGAFLARQGETDTFEHLILNGKAISHIGDAEGRNICVAFHVGPSILTPNIARARSQKSLVGIELVSDARVASMPSNELLQLMVASEAVRDWANAILRNEIGLKAEREWCLAALKGVDRLNWFRGRFPNHEDMFGHAHIASFLGMTTVTLSRLRKLRSA